MFFLVTPQGLQQGPKRAVCVCVCYCSTKGQPVLGLLDWWISWLLLKSFYVPPPPPMQAIFYEACIMWHILIDWLVHPSVHPFHVAISPFWGAFCFQCIILYNNIKNEEQNGHVYQNYIDTNVFHHVTLNSQSWMNHNVFDYSLIFNYLIYLIYLFWGVRSAYHKCKRSCQTSQCLTKHNV